MPLVFNVDSEPVRMGWIVQRLEAFFARNSFLTRNLFLLVLGTQADSHQVSTKQGQGAKWCKFSQLIQSIFKPNSGASLIFRDFSFNLLSATSLLENWVTFLMHQKFGWNAPNTRILERKLCKKIFWRYGNKTNNFESGKNYTPFCIVRNSSQTFFLEKDTSLCCLVYLKAS